MSHNTQCMHARMYTELFYFTGIQTLRDRYKLCIDKGSECVEK